MKPLVKGQSGSGLKSYNSGNNSSPKRVSHGVIGAAGGITVEQHVKNGHAISIIGVHTVDHGNHASHDYLKRKGSSSDYHHDGQSSKHSNSPQDRNSGSKKTKRH